VQSATDAAGRACIGNVERDLSSSPQCGPWEEGRLAVPEIFDVPSASDGDKHYARELLARDGFIPLSDRRGHAVAVQLWRDHYAKHRDVDVDHLYQIVEGLLAGPRPAPPQQGTSGPEQLAWVRPADIAIVRRDDFPYHGTRADLAEHAHRLLRDGGSPSCMSVVLGNQFIVSSFAAPHGLCHRVTVNGSHRNVAIRAGFPVALVVMSRVTGPWKMRRPIPTAYLRLLLRSGLVFNLHKDEYSDVVVDTLDLAEWLLSEDPREARSILIDYEKTYGRLLMSGLEWIRDQGALDGLLRDEEVIMPMNWLADLDMIAGAWPPPRPSWRQRLLHSLRVSTG
jgi:hypothetical protein